MIVVHYFPGRGRAGHIRMLLADAGIPYRDHHYSFFEFIEERGKHPKESVTRFKKLPAIIDEATGLHLNESTAILFYLGT